MKYLKSYKIFEGKDNNFNELIKDLNKYNLDTNDFAIFGSAPLYVKGDINTINDLDVIVRPSKWNLYFDTDNELRTKNIEFFNNWPGFDIEDLIDNHTFESDGIKFVNTDKVMEYKLKMKREKDSNIWKNFESFSMRRENCDRCGKSTGGATIMSTFNEDIICMNCKEEEKNDPEYKSAVDLEREEIKKGNMNYKGMMPNYKPIRIN